MYWRSVVCVSQGKWSVWLKSSILTLRNHLCKHLKSRICTAGCDLCPVVLMYRSLPWRTHYITPAHLSLPSRTHNILFQSSPVTLRKEIILHTLRNVYSASCVMAVTSEILWLGMWHLLWSYSRSRYKFWMKLNWMKSDKHYNWAKYVPYRESVLMNVVDINRVLMQNSVTLGSKDKNTVTF
jgi:hypothetical protein